MRHHPNRLAVILVATCLSVWGLHDARSEGRTIKIIDPFAPGAPTTAVARLLADQIARTHGSTIVIENRAGAGSAIGTESVSRADPDGNTLLITSPVIVINSQLRKLNYDPLTSFVPICLLVSSPNVIAVNDASPYRTFADLLGAARAKPGQITLASVGPASANHIAFEMLKRAANVDITFVPYSGAAQAVNAVLGQHVTAFFGIYPNVVAQLNAGKLRALATASRTRVASMPDVPTVAESGYKDFEADLWLGLFAPARTPQGTVTQLADWFAAALHEPEVRSKLVTQGLYPVGTCGADFGDFVRRQYDEYGRAIREAHIVVD